MTMEVTSSAFQAGEAIPTKYTCEGANISPPLQWSGVPAVAKSLALICDDPDAPVGTWVHLVLSSGARHAGEAGGVGVGTNNNRRRSPALWAKPPWKSTG